jgi:hypothetical protein
MEMAAEEAVVVVLLATAASHVCAKCVGIAAAAVVRSISKDDVNSSGKASNCVLLLLRLSCRTEAGIPGCCCLW